MNAIRQMIFTNWNFIRWLRLGLGIYIAAQAVQASDVLIGIIAVFFLYQSVTNTGCCSTRSCAVPW